MIRKVKGGFRVVSRKGKNLGTYKGKNAKARAKKRLRQIEFFKHKKSRKRRGRR